MGSFDRTVLSDILLGSILDSVAAGVFSVDLNGRCTFINQTASQWLGYGNHALLGCDVQALMDHCMVRSEPGSKSLLLREIPVAERSVAVLRHRDGSKLPVEYTCQPLVEAGILRGSVITFTKVEAGQSEVDELARALEALRQERAEREQLAATRHVLETRLAALFEQSPVSIQILSTDGRTLKVNRAWESLFGLTLADIGDFNLLEDRQLLDLEIVPYIRRAFAGEITAVPAVFCDPRLIFPSAGEPNWTMGLLYPVKDETGAVREVVLMHQDITALKQAEQSRSSAVLEERNRLAREIHDTLAQSLTGIIVQLQAAQDQYTAPGDQHTHIEQACILAREGLAEARRSVQALRPRALTEADLFGALTRFVERRADEAGVRTECRLTGQPYPLPDEVENNLLRIAQEALTNAFKHAQAHLIHLELSFEPGRVQLSIADDGLGFDPYRPLSDGFGLVGMHERSRSIGAELMITSRPAQGTQVTVAVLTNR